MSGASVGVDCIELAAWMVEKGASDVVNFDSGGSAAIVIDEFSAVCRGLSEISITRQRISSPFIVHLSRGSRAM